MMKTAVNEQRLELVALAWLWCQRDKPATEAKLATGIKAMVPEGSAKALASAAIERLIQAEHAEYIPSGKKKPSQFKITAAGESAVRQRLQISELPAGASPFGSISSCELPAIASELPLPGGDNKSRKEFAGLLPVMVCVRHFNLQIPLESGPVTAKLELVKLALSRLSQVSADRIYLKKLPTGPLPALVVGPLLKEPGTAIANVDKLLVATACKILSPCKPAQIKFGIVRRWLFEMGVESAARSDVMREADVTQPPPRPSPGVPGEGEKFPAQIHPRTSPSDLAAFSRQALAAAHAVADAGGPGVSSLGDKVLVHYAWRQYEKTYGPLPLDRFKQNLSLVNGEHLVLVREDLIPGERAQEFSQSEVRTGESRFHYIRVSNLRDSHA
jgi:hypothetical protein